MNKFSYSFPIVLPGCIQTDAQVAASTKVSDQSQIEKASVQFVEAYNQHDAKSISALFADDGELVERDGSRFAGSEEIADAFEARPVKILSRALGTAKSGRSRDYQSHISAEIVGVMVSATFPQSSPPEQKSI